MQHPPHNPSDLVDGQLLLLTNLLVKETFHVEIEVFEDEVKLLFTVKNLE